MALSKPSPQKGTKKKKQKDPFSQMSVASGAGLIACTAVLIFVCFQLLTQKNGIEKKIVYAHFHRDF